MCDNRTHRVEDRIVSIHQPHVHPIVKSKFTAKERNFESVSEDILKHLPRMGTDCSFIMNSYESNYFNIIYKDTERISILQGKKVGFITGSNAGTLSNKQKYFDDEKKRFATNSLIISSQLYIFNEDEKVQSGGYDAVIVSWSKVLVSHKDWLKS